MGPAKPTGDISCSQDTLSFLPGVPRTCQDPNTQGEQEQHCREIHGRTTGQWCTWGMPSSLPSSSRPCLRWCLANPKRITGLWCGSFTILSEEVKLIQSNTLAEIWQKSDLAGGCSRFAWDMNVLSVWKCHVYCLWYVCDSAASSVSVWVFDLGQHGMAWCSMGFVKWEPIGVGISASCESKVPYVPWTSTNGNQRSSKITSLTKTNINTHIRSPAPAFTALPRSSTRRPSTLGAKTSTTTEANWVKGPCCWSSGWSMD